MFCCTVVSGTFSFLIIKNKSCLIWKDLDWQLFIQNINNEKIYSFRTQRNGISNSAHDGERFNKLLMEGKNWKLKGLPYANFSLLYWEKKKVKSICYICNIPFFLEWGFLHIVLNYLKMKILYRHNFNV